MTHQPNYRSQLLLALLLITGLAGALWLVGCNAKYEGSNSPTSTGAWDSNPDEPGAMARESRNIPAPYTSPPIKSTQPHTTAAESGDADSPYTTISDEVWVIVKPRNGKSNAAGMAMERQHEDDKYPGCGAMVTTLPNRTEQVPLPLKHTDVKAGVAGYIATVDVTQQFHNPYSEKIEAVYVFPLPQDAAVNDFMMIIGDRRIRGIIREKEEAERIYEQAKRQGYRASIMTQQRPNIFTQKVANIEPGKQIDVKIRYFNTLSYVDGWYQFVFPMVVGPRYNPAYSDDPVHAVSRETITRRNPNSSGTAVSYMRPHERSGHDIALSLDIDAGVSIEEIISVNHRITQTSEGSGPVNVRIADGDSIPNKDFVLRFRVAGKQLKTTMMTWRDPANPNDGYFTLMVYPPNVLDDLQRVPMEMIFVLDCSGSMSGTPLQQSKDAMHQALRRLNRNDSFQVIRFSNDASKLGSAPLPATAENISRGRRYIDSLHSSGGTQMIEGIKAALGYHHDPDKLRFVCFLTDGYIGNEKDIIQEVDRRIGDSRVFSFGVGSSPNRYLMHRMAKVGRGSEAFLANTQSGGEVMDAFFDRVSHPAMTNLQINFGNMQVSEVYPKRLPDLFVGRPVIITGRFSGHGRTQVVITGRAGRNDIEMGINVDLDRADSKHQGIAAVWARKKIAELHDQYALTENRQIPQQIKQVALNYNLMSDYTAFIAVDSAYKTQGDHGVTVNQPVPVPDGVRYRTTVNE